MLKILTILGARPQFVKAAVVSRAIQVHNLSAPESHKIREYIVHTGQHFDRNMSDVFFEEMQIPKPDIFLGINQLSHGAMTGRMVEEIEKVLLAEKPDAVLIYGDTNSTLAGALAAVKLHIPIAHVEAGLRSFNRMMPEEHNRVMADHVSSFLFCPTEKAVENLRREGLDGYPRKADDRSAVSSPGIFLVGDVMYDAARYYSEKAEKNSRAAHGLIEEKLSNRPFVLVTLHRAENTDETERLRSILDSLKLISNTMPIVWPIHPRTSAKIKECGLPLPENNERFHVVEPVGYFDMIELLRNCRLVMTDSGGVQKEAFFFAKPCVTLREQTEWVELAEHGFNRVAGVDPGKIRDAFDEMLHKELDFRINLYGNGNAGGKIVSILFNNLSSAFCIPFPAILNEV